MIFKYLPQALHILVMLRGIFLYPSLQLKIAQKQQFIWDGEYELLKLSPTTCYCQFSTFTIQIEAENIEIEAMLEQRMIISVEGLQKCVLEQLHE